MTIALQFPAKDIKKIFQQDFFVKRKESAKTIIVKPVHRKSLQSYKHSYHFPASIASSEN